MYRKNTGHSPGRWLRKGLLPCLLFALAGMAGCGADREQGGERDSAGGGSADEIPVVAATVGMIADVARQVAGEGMTVIGIIGEGVDPHLYKPTRRDVVTLRQADMVFYNGLMLEGKMGDVLARVAADKPVHAVTEQLLERDDYVLTDGANHYDPHVWMDVGGWMRAVTVVADAMAAFDPERARDYRANAATYREQLTRLDAYARESIGSIPEGRRVLVTAHDAFNYLGRAYGLEVRGIQGLSTESEAGVRDIERLVAFLVARKIPAVFVETSVSDKNVRALVEGARAGGHDLVIGGALFSDAMGKAGTYEGTYMGMIDHNVTTITRALGGTAPAGGMRGKLGHGD
uniref:Manganese/zinc/iron transport system substrate-binding protein n=1 Tax=Candidatus Kentrum sp. FW TaxID=2126338 RepID=A0A450TCT2_9GAMM|nr:MAG: manganese/zinc/iron transport system substrate-binding protein [Candidatus Kentron sp. FW]VFJ64748.1 MAG: manganese/zinc/iron transport system substrate-binding protein [Candidatus Kentron sp. FW]